MRIQTLVVAGLCVTATSCASVRADDLDIQHAMQGLGDKVKESTGQVAAAAAQTSEQIKHAIDSLRKQLGEHHKPIEDTLSQAAKEVVATVQEGAAQIGDTIAQAAAAIKQELDHDHTADGLAATQAQPSRQCRRACPKVFAPVCGTDGKTYSNRCEMERITCEGGYNAEVKHEGKCESTDTPALPKKLFDPCWKACTRELQPVCGTDNKTYGNKCVLEVKQCRMGGEGMLSLAHEGKCKEDEVKIDTSSCMKACTRDYRPLCGSDGRTYSNQCTFEIAECINKLAGKGALTVAHHGQCAKAGKPQCPLFCTLEYAPVCATTGKTFPNKCALNAEACRHPDKGIAFAHEGECVAGEAANRHHYDSQEQDEDMDGEEVALFAIMSFSFVLLSTFIVAVVVRNARLRRMQAGGMGGGLHPPAMGGSVKSAPFAGGPPPGYSRVLAEDSVEDDPDELFAPEYTAPESAQGYAPVKTTATDA